jgi:hypothetical protein
LGSAYSPDYLQMRSPRPVDCLQAVLLRLNTPQCTTWVSRVATPVLSSDVHNHRLRSLHLDLKGGDQCVLRINNDMIHCAVMLEPDRELQGHISSSRLLLKSAGKNKADGDINACGRR